MRREWRRAASQRCTSVPSPRGPPPSDPVWCRSFLAAGLPCAFAPFLSILHPNADQVCVCVTLHPEPTRGFSLLSG